MKSFDEQLAEMRRASRELAARRAKDARLVDAEIQRQRERLAGETDFARIEEAIQTHRPAGH